jgi:broad specificity phosphatase PhoE
MPTRVLLLRHAETSDPSVVHGSESDIGLSDLGYAQAAGVARYLATQSPHIVISSNMLRARLTAEPIVSACGVAHEIEPLLHERSMGPLSGLPGEQNKPIWMATLERWMAGDIAYSPEGVESYLQMRDRLLPVWERITTKHANKTLVVVAHGVVCKILLTSLLPDWGVQAWNRPGPIKNCAIHELLCDDGGPWHAARINEMMPGTPGG